MTDRERKAVLHALASAQASIDFALAVMMGDKPRACEHPEEKRQDLRGMGGGAEHFYCKACQTEVDRRGETTGPDDGGGNAETIPGTDGTQLPD